MAESNAAPAANRPRPAVLALLAIALAALVVYMLWPAAATAPSPSNLSREQRRQAAAKGTAGGQEPAGAATVKLGALKQPPAAPEDAKGRNPFRFYTPPPPPPLPPPKALLPGARGDVAPPPPQPLPQAGPPPIPLKFIGIVEKNGRKVAIFVSTDGKGMPQYAGEGELVMGQYRVVRIGVESVTVEYLDGRGRQTIPMRG